MKCLNLENLLFNFLIPGVRLPLFERLRERKKHYTKAKQMVSDIKSDINKIERG